MNAPGYAGTTPLHLAVDIEMEDAIYRYDVEHDSNPPRNDITRLLLRYGANAQLKDQNGRTPLDWAVGRGHVSAQKLLEAHTV